MDFDEVDLEAEREKQPLKSTDFDLGKLFLALDAQRKERSLSWSQATREMNRGSSEHTHRLSSTTVTNLRSRKIAEADGILQMLLWLNRTPESFVPVNSRTMEDIEKLPNVAPGKVLRFDTRKLYAAINVQRIKKRMTWSQLADEIGLGVSSITHLSKGGRTAFPSVMRILRWLKEPASHFVRESER